MLWILWFSSSRTCKKNTKVQIRLPIIAAKVLLYHCWIFSFIDPRGQPTVLASSDHYFCSCCLSVRPSVPTFQNLTKQNNFQVRIVLATGRTVGRGSGRVDHWCHSCLVLFYVQPAALISWRRRKRIKYFLSFSDSTQKIGWKYKISKPVRPGPPYNTVILFTELLLCTRWLY